MDSAKSQLVNIVQIAVQVESRLCGITERENARHGARRAVRVGYPPLSVELLCRRHELRLRSSGRLTARRHADGLRSLGWGMSVWGCLVGVGGFGVGVLGFDLR